MSDSTNHIELAAEIVSAYVSNNSVPSGVLPTLLSDVHITNRACRDWRAASRSRGSQARRPAEEVDYQRLHHLLGGRS